MKIDYIRKLETVQQVRDEVLAAPVIGIDTETTGLDPLSSELRLLQLSTGPERAFVFDLKLMNKNAQCFQFIRDILNDPSTVKIFQNAKFDIKFLRHHFAAKEFATIYDTYLASQLIACGDDQERHNLQELASKYAGVNLDKEQQRSDFSVNELTEEQIRYSGIDACILHEVRSGQNKHISALGLERVCSLEFDAVDSVVLLELNGIYLNKDKWLHRVNDQTEKIKEVGEKLKQHFSKVAEVSLFGELDIDLESHKQVLVALKKLGVPVEDTTGEPAIKHLASKYPVIADLLDYRELSTALKMFGLEYVERIHEFDGRVHSDFKQIGTPTGRFTGNKPNLQQVPQHSQYRGCFEAQEGNKLIIADYSQIELRIMAQFSRDEHLLKNYENDEDLHAFTADQVSKIVGQSIPRHTGKGLNFGTAYGVGPTRFAASSGLTYKEAADALNAFWKVYSGLDVFLKESGQRAVDELESHSYSGRTWRFDCDPTDMKSSSQVNRLGRNFPIQATCSDILKRSMYLMTKKFEGTSGKLVNIVHDETVTECSANEVEEVKKIVSECMMEAGEQVLSLLPCKVDIKVEDRWVK